MTYEDIALTLQTGRAALFCSTIDIRTKIMRKLSKFIPLGFENLDGWDWCHYIFCSSGCLHVCNQNHVDECHLLVYQSDVLDDIEDTLSALDRPDIDELITLLLTTESKSTH